MTSITLVPDITTKQTMNNSGVGMSKWSHLANAKHIDRIIAHVNALITLVPDITTKQTMNNSGVGMSKWSHLANAKHIDRIIAHVNAHPTAWEKAGYNAAWEKTCDAARDAATFAAFKAGYNAAWEKTCDAARDTAWDEVFKAAHDAVKDKSCDAAYEAIIALVTWNHAGGLMDLPAEQVKVLALLGDQAASLMYPAIVAMETRCRLTI